MHSAHREPTKAADEEHMVPIITVALCVSDSYVEYLSNELTVRAGHWSIQLDKLSHLAVFLFDDLL